MAQVKAKKTQLYRMQCDFCKESSPSFSNELDAINWGAERDYERHYDHNYCKSCWILQCLFKNSSNGKISRLITEEEALKEKAKLPKNRSYKNTDEVMDALEDIISNCEDRETYHTLIRFLEMLDTYLQKPK